MDFNRFLGERRPRWQRLGELLDRVDRRGLSGLSAAEADELFALYRLTSSDLSLVQTRTGSLSVLDALEGLVARAYAHLQVPRRARPLWHWWMILRHYFPAALRRHRRAVAAAGGAMLLGTLLGAAATLASPSAAETFVGPEHLQQTPSARVADLERRERDGGRSIDGAAAHTLFTVFLFNNNIRVSVLAFALGMTFGVGTLVVLFFNGAMLGSLAALYWADGQTEFFVAWVGPHGALELPCVVFAGAAGLVLAGLQLRRDRGPLRQQVRRARPVLVDLIVGTATLLVVAGVVEGGFSQINEPTLSYPFKTGVAAVLLTLLVAYVVWMPVRPRPADGSPDGAGLDRL